MAESYWRTVTLCHAGQEYSVTLDGPSAARLLSGDVEFAERVLENVKKTQGETDVSATLPTETVSATLPTETDVSATLPTETESSSTNEVASKYVWTGNKSEAGRKQDRAATFQLLDIVGSDKYRQMFRDDKTRKASIWKQVVVEMKNAGIKLDDDNKTAAHKCDQKYRNLERQYKDFVQYMNTTGKGKKSKPEYYEEMAALWGDKHTVRPVALVDTILPQVVTAPEEANMPESVRPKPSVAKKRKSKSSEIVEILGKMQKEDHERQTKVIETVEKMSEAINQRHQQQLQEDRAQFQEYVKMHNEKMEMQRRLIEALTSKHS
ncbi:uncharacterized protein LOC119742093 [Patiria miniata]|uniref:Myb/SANT-like DNA-binding domain-containing protein n=1 Tax=Patiria miniata TaxID=46514 RepID=A0A914BDH2_PATMI|nr:uncharacterized protein LOC119742093 [Patiria miniata]